LVSGGRTQTGLTPLNVTYNASTPQIYADIDRTQVEYKGVSLSNVFSTLSTYMGSTYINDFNKFGRVYQVRAQAEPRFRLKPEDLLQLEIRNSKGEMMPLSAVTSIKEILGPTVLNRYNLYTSPRSTAPPPRGSARARP
jgi:HAE1 family hydrophobic/amphiphilic exporter-1